LFWGKREREGGVTENILNNKSLTAASEWLENLDFEAGTENSYRKKFNMLWNS